ncbi:MULTISPECIES: TetR/AcrR family transcriptional regulator [unclassified Rhizobium]|uniref:TetR/AcrR family transcriptional regulator n=1 Tax=unclassified Rhizobium TaxID=2613769 RepID=UPI000AEB830F|nr:MULTISPECIES: TetR/AcrR family transcriptional regulator [unclassified Rhizobium]
MLEDEGLMKLKVREELKLKKQAYVQEEILTAAAALFAETGVRAVTIDDIASSLGYTKSVVYYYFKNKNQVLWEIFERIHEAWSQDMTSIMEKDLPPAELLGAMIRQHALNVMGRKAWTAIYFRDQAELTSDQQKIIVKRKREYDQLFKTVYTKGVEAGIFRDIPTPVIVSGIIGMANFTHAWFKDGRGLAPEEIANHYVEIILNGCRTA